jgi:hypothetical protein
VTQLEKDLLALIEKCIADTQEKMEKGVLALIEKSLTEEKGEPALWHCVMDVRAKLAEALEKIDSFRNPKREPTRAVYEGEECPHCGCPKHYISNPSMPTIHECWACGNIWNPWNEKYKPAVPQGADHHDQRQDADNRGSTDPAGSTHVVCE